MIYYYNSPSFSSFDIRILKLFLYVTTAIPDKGLIFKFKMFFDRTFFILMEDQNDVYKNKKFFITDFMFLSSVLTKRKILSLLMYAQVIKSS